MALRVPPGWGMKSWKWQGMIVQTVDHFCDDTENFDTFTVGIEAMIDNIEDAYKRRDVRKKIEKSW